MSHIPFRSWCPHCVRGRGKSYAHRRVHRSDDPDAVPVISIDYGFLGAPGELPSDAVGGAKMPVLVVRDRKSKALFTHLVPSKGVEHFYPEQALCRDIKFLGYPSVVIKSDQEPSIKAVAEAVKNAFAQSNVRVQLEHSPKGETIMGSPMARPRPPLRLLKGCAGPIKRHARQALARLSIPSRLCWHG